MLGTRDQDGSWNGTVWADDTLLVNEAAGHYAGLRFSGFPHGHQECLLRSAALGLNPVPVPGQLPCRLQVWARGGTAQAPWTTAAHPQSILSLDPRREFLLAVYDFTATGSQVISIPLDLPGLLAARQVGWVAGGSWDGGWSFHLHATTGDGTDLFINHGSETLTVDADPRTFTGIENGLPLREQKQSRPDFCPICGDETFREDWVFCNLHERLECPRCADPGLGEEPDIPTGRFQLAGED